MKKHESDIVSYCIAPARSAAIRGISYRRVPRVIVRSRPSQFLRPKDKKAVTAHLWMAARIAKNAEVIGVIQLDLRSPGSAADDTAAERGEGIHLVSNAAARLESRALHQRPRAGQIGIQEKQRLIAIDQIDGTIPSRKQLIERDPWQKGQCQRFPFITCWPTRQPEGREAIQVPADPAVSAEDETVSLAVHERHAAGGQRKGTDRLKDSFLLDVRRVERDAAPWSPMRAMSVDRIASKGIASMWEFHEVSVEHVDTHPKMQPSLVGVIRNDKVGIGPLAVVEPNKAGLVGQGDFQRIVLVTRREQLAIADAEPPATRFHMTSTPLIS